MKIDLSCSGCGSDKFDYPLVLTDDAQIMCSACGRQVGTVAEIQQKLMQQMRNEGAGGSA